MAWDDVPLGWARDREDWDALRASARPMCAVPTGFKAPKSISFRRIAPSTRNQGQAGSCTGFGRTRASTAITYWQTGKIVNYSPLWAYKTNQLASGISGIMSGATIGGTVEAGKNAGEVLAESYPYDLNRYSEKLPRGLYDEGSNRQVLYHCTLQSAQEMFDWLATGKGAIIIGVDWTQRLANARRTIDDVSGRSAGGHCMAITGYDGDELDEDGNPRFELDNSHGPEYGEQGTTLVGWKAVAQWFEQRYSDIRGVTDIETDEVRPFYDPLGMLPTRKRK